ncbi:MAG TPA: S-methyl-5'-thioinosine phosphorylase [Gammaproteobacteria bacterium]|nr:S-methyl-5'-thioinosine phosphorylase [Gammaproteobacteria bacterium]
MSETAIIGGTGLTSLNGLEIVRREVVNTPYGEPSGPLVHGRLQGHGVVFLPRHGSGHTIPPHRINYRANIWALHSIGVRSVIAVNAVGGIDDSLTPGCLVFPDQIIDYTWSRINTFFEDGLSSVVHVDFTRPYSEELRSLLIEAARVAGLHTVNSGTYGATQGPRLETAAEIDRLERDGCHMVGMTGMPEAALARELGLSYAACAVVANMAAGRGREGETISMDLIRQHLESGMEKVCRLLVELVPRL